MNDHHQSAEYRRCPSVMLLAAIGASAFAFAGGTAAAKESVGVQQPGAQGAGGGEEKLDRCMKLALRVPDVQLKILKARKESRVRLQDETDGAFDCHDQVHSTYIIRSTGINRGRRVPTSPRKRVREGSPELFSSPPEDGILLYIGTMPNRKPRAKRPLTRVNEIIKDTETGERANCVTLYRPNSSVVKSSCPPRVGNYIPRRPRQK